MIIFYFMSFIKLFIQNSFENFDYLLFNMFTWESYISYYLVEKETHIRLILIGLNYYIHK